MSIDEMIDATIGREGGYSNHPDDTGGETMWGITHRVARANGYAGPMRDMPRSTAVSIYKREYADKPGFSAVSAIYPEVAAELFDTGVNMGPSWPSIWLQRCLNALNNQGRLFADIAVDGRIGPGTLRALTAYHAARGAEGGKVLLSALNALQGARYIDLAEKRGQNESFLYGWLRTRVAA